METGLSTTHKQPVDAVIQKLQDSVQSVIVADQLQGFERAYLVATAAGELKRLLDDKYMKPIMALQGNRLGFKTDQDKTGGYSQEVVKNCLIEAVLMGVQPCGNQFNIIASNCYLTKEGVGYLLKKLPGLSYDLVPGLPRINAEKTSAAVVMKLTWTINHITKEKDIEIPVKMNSMMGTDAVIGKATRKARKWLYDTITGSDIPEGDIYDNDVPLVIDAIGEKKAELKANSEKTTIEMP
jgi:hypothetical protein